MLRLLLLRCNLLTYLSPLTREKIMLNSTKKILAILVLGIFTAIITASLNNNWKFSNTTPNLAPVFSCDHPGRVPGFIVQLRQGHSLKAHLAALATPNDLPIGKILDWGDFIMYYIEVDDEILDLIRADPEVKGVVCNHQGVGVR
jgi:hypothetical protein